MQDAFSYTELQSLFLKSIIGQQSAIIDVMATVQSSDFEDGRLKMVYEAVLDLHSTFPNGFTPAHMVEYMESKGEKPTKTDLSLFFNPPTDPPLLLARLLKQKSVIHQTRQLIEKTQTELEKGGQTMEVLGELQNKIKDLSQHLMPPESWNLEDSLNSFLETISTTETKKTNRIPSFYPSLDEYTGGWGPEQLITVTARPGVGKSVMATNCAVTALIAGKSVLFFSLEMNEQELYQRMIANIGNLLLSDIFPRYNPTYEQEIQEAVNLLKTYKLTLDCSPNATIDYIKSKAEQVAKGPDGLDFIIIDYLQLIKHTRGTRSRQEEVAEISRSMKLLAKQLGVPVMVVAQLKRKSGEVEEDALPSMEDIRESGAIAADSDIVIVLHRKYRDESMDPKAVIILDKNRSGPSDKKIKVRCVLEKAMFLDPKMYEDESDEELYDSDLAELDDAYSDPFDGINFDEDVAYD